MLDAGTIRRLFLDLDRELAKLGVKGEIGLCGGAVMCLVFRARKATKDIDAVFEPRGAIRRAAHAVALGRDLDDDWLNDAAKSFFLADPPKTGVLELKHLRVWAPTAEYMLAMKCVSARFDTRDRDDVIFLIKHLGLVSAGAVFDIIKKYYPRKMIPAKTQFLVEEIMADSSGSTK